MSTDKKSPEELTAFAGLPVVEVEASAPTRADISGLPVLSVKETHAQIERVLGKLTFGRPNPNHEEGSC
jgi:hypothetical protein